MNFIMCKLTTVTESLLSIDILYFVGQVAVYGMYVPTMAFFAKVSDPVIGGTYMTLLNTITNLGM